MSMEKTMSLIEDWFENFFEKLKEKPIPNLFIFFVSIIIIYALGATLYNAFGLITAIGYIFACTYGITEIIDKPERAVVWAVGYIIGALIMPFILESLVPQIKKADWSSLIAILIVGLVIFMFYLKSRELKNY